MKIVLDTNVLVSALLKKGTPPSRVLELVYEGQWHCLITTTIIREYEKVLRRPKFRFEDHVIVETLDFLSSSLLPSPPDIQGLSLPDPSDMAFLIAARFYGVDALVTGNTKDFPREKCRPIPILSPMEAIERLDS